MDQRLKKRRTIVIASLVGAVAIVIGLISFTSGSSSEEEKKSAVDKQTNYALNTEVKSYETLTVNNDTVSLEVPLTGRVQPVNHVTIAAEVSGTLLPSSQPFEDGNTFRRGELMLRIDAEEFVLNLQSQKSKFMSAITSVMSDLKMDYPQAFEQWDTYLEDFDVEQSIPNIPETTDKQVRYFLAARGIYDQYYAIRSQEKRLTEFYIYAPFDGAVISSNVDAGALVSAGTPLGEFISTHAYEMEAAVDLSNLEHIQVGDRVTMRSRETNGEWTGTIARISQKIDPNTQNVSVYVAINSSELKEGMYLEGELRVGTIENAVEIDKDIMNRNNQVYAIQDSTVRLVAVEPVHYSPSTVVVRGLDNDQHIINEKITQSVVGSRAVASTSSSVE